MVINASDRYDIITLIKKKNTFIKFQKQPFVDAFQKKVFFKISQNSQENKCTGVIF